MKTIKLMADYRCFPLWNVSPGDYANISPNSLPISSSLRQDLNAWADEYDRTLDLNSPSDAGFDSQRAADQFVATGYSLLNRLQKELGSSYKITHILKACPKSSAV